ncbi:MAG: aminotransferase class I/II-fold pyridoxal phosphate-dependent enzyme [Planctomycetes bacterium]|nr:aminotransferase class I/II-fold pyridoxal phosphate-dependent enzyme [Planctomycetota bacterium]
MPTHDMPRDRTSKRLAGLRAYAFAEIDRKVEELRRRGVKATDFGVGDPTTPTPRIVRETCKRAVDRHASAGYPSYVGSAPFREAAASWMKRRFGVALDPATEICATLGSKEAVFHAHEAFVNPADAVLCPSPGYPPSYRGTLFAEGRPVFYPLRESEGFRVPLGTFRKGDAARARFLWICYPNNPTGAVAPATHLRRIVEECQERGVTLFSDEAYTEMYFTREPPHSALEFGREGVLAFHSLSKRSAMTGYRVGFVAGDARLVAAFKKLKTNIDSGVPNFVQDAAIAAWSDEKHVHAMRRDTRARRDALVDALARAGLPRCISDGTLYIWQRLPKGVSDVAFATRLLDPDIAVAVTPGSAIAEPLADGTNPGTGYVRFALVPPLADTRAAGRRIGQWREPLREHRP